MIDRTDMKKVHDIIDTYTPRVDLGAGIPLSEYRLRHEKVWAELSARNIDLGFFFWYREMPGEGMYMTGYNPTLERATHVAGRP